MKRIIYLAYLWVCLIPALLSSCQDDRGDLSSSQPGSGVRVSFELPDYVQLGTRATSESALKDVAVLQYIGGTLAKKIVLEDRLFIQAVELDELEPMVASTLDSDGKLVSGGENVLVFLANVKVVFGDGVLTYFSDGSTYEKMKAYTASFANAQALANAEYMPMTGFYYGGIADGVTNQINVTLTRSLAKINFTLNTENFRYGGNTVAISVNTIELRNIPQLLTFFPQNRPSLPAGGQPGEWPAQQTPYPVATGAGDPAIGTDATNFMSLTRDENQSSSVATNFVAYMPENARGSYPAITSNYYKRPGSVDPGCQQGWSYIYVDLDFTTPTGMVKNAKYTIYLGGDDKGDINILAGTQYNVTTYLYGANEMDTRITLSTIFDSTVTDGLTANDLLQEPANSYIIQSGGSKYSGKDFIIPLVQARNGWRHIQSATRSYSGNTDMTDYVAEFDALIKNGTWDVVTLWRTWDNTGGSAITGTSKTLTTASSDNGMYFISIPGVDLDQAPVGSNCVIALRSTADNTVWWTWHLWFTDYDPDAVAPLKGETHTYFSEAFTPSGLYHNKKMMDRNLGATITGVMGINAQPTSDAPKYYGLLYQWGRKDPFTGSGDGSTTMGNAVKIYNVNGDLITGSGNDIDGFPKVPAGEVLSAGVANNNLVAAIRTPMNYYYGGGSSNDWTLQDNTLWNTTSKTVFDPCPPGWCVPVGGTNSAYNPWSGFGYGVSNNTANNGAYNTTFSVNGPFPWSAAVTGQTGSAGRLYGANTTTGIGDFNWSTYGTPWSNGDVAWYPASGRRESASGAFNHTGTNANYWSSAVNGSNGYNLYFSTVVYPIAGDPRASAFPARCVQN